MPLLLLFLFLSSTALASEADSKFWAAKGAYFKALLEGKPEAIRDTAEEMRKWNVERTETAVQNALQGKIAESESRRPYSPGDGYKMAELDMVQKIKETEKARLVRIFRQAKAELKKIRAQKQLALNALAKGKSDSRRQKVIALFTREFELAKKSVEDSAKIIAGEDADYAYRAYLREHRRLHIQ